MNHAKHFTEVALDILFVTKTSLSRDAVEALGHMMDDEHGTMMFSRNCGGFWESVLENAGLIEHIWDKELGIQYRLTQYAVDTMLDPRGEAL